MYTKGSQKVWNFQVSKICRKFFYRLKIMLNNFQLFISYEFLSLLYILLWPTYRKAYHNQAQIYNLQSLNFSEGDYWEYLLVCERVLCCNNFSDNITVAKYFIKWCQIPADHMKYDSSRQHMRPHAGLRSAIRKMIRTQVWLQPLSRSWSS